MVVRTARIPSVGHPDISGGPSPASDEYRRQARKLRSKYRNDPARLHRSLRQLSRDADARAVETCDPDAPAADFALAVLAAMDGAVLRYSVRLALIRQAESLGIGRFEANLIIAAIQHRVAAGCRLPIASCQTPDLAHLPASPSSLRRFVASSLLPFILLQSAILLAVWSLLR